MTMNVIKKSLFVGATSLAFIYAFSGPAVVQAQSYDQASVGATEERFQNLEAEIRRLNGVVEQQGHEINSLKSELSRFQGDLEVRFNDIQKSGGVTNAVSDPSASSGPVGATGAAEPDLMEGEPQADNLLQKTKQSSSFNYEPPAAATSTEGQLGTLTKSSDTGEVTKSGGAEASYEYAYSFIKARDFERAEDEFNDFIKQYPDHALMSNAMYWYGETFYVRANYDKAARVFAEGYKKYPKGSKAASNLLKLGMSLSSLGKKQEACIAYKQLQKDYATSSVPVLKKTKEEIVRLGCK